MPFSITPQTSETLKTNFATKVFYNHFSAIKHHIASFNNRYELRQTAYYNSLASRGNQIDVAEIKKLLWCMEHGAIKQFNQSVISGHYPQAINSYAKGEWKETVFCNITFKMPRISLHCF